MGGGSGAACGNAHDRGAGAAARWNRARYRFWAPVYDGVARLLDAARREALAAVAVRAGDSVLVVGVGTGLDLPALPRQARVAAVDVTPAMLARARRRAPWCAFVCGDARRLPFAVGRFDVVLLHLVITVAGDAPACLREAARVVRPGGRVSVLDKFVPDGARPSVLRRVLNLGACPAFSDLTVDFGRALAESGAPLAIVSRRPVAFSGAYEAILLARTNTA